ncbi:ABC transporter ATP-binding protein [Oceanirhabdus sp. W0125-5]|uniref:ABC transporter ATP-binding protein n=1 Tax=Oceanirhabdus sp. W0125-5 TaxID=2999116 RepID=UPI0022F2C10F|nr:ABC transporter ATP-binding protein [Oceanirhabdus sp. W0125-5]WBW97751.1 ABC transporter ATP-binding protein [Oceanirhabdus sp. W0125-5]
MKKKKEVHDKIFIMDIIKLLKLCWDKQKFSLIVLSFTMIIQALFPFVTLLSIQQILNYLQTGEYRKTFVFLGIYFIVLLLTNIVQSIFNYYENCFKVNIHYDIKCIITEKSSSLKLIDYENSDTYDNLVRALKEAQSPYRVINAIFKLTSRVISFFGSLVVLITWNPKIIFFIIIMPIISLFYSLKIGKYEFNVMQKRSADSRKVQYLSSLLNNAKSYKENKALGIDEYLFERYRNKFKEFVNKDKQIIKTKFKYNTLFKILEKVCGSFVISLVIYSATQGKILIGNVNTYINCIWRITSDADAIMSNIGHIYSSSLYLRNLFDFLEYNQNKDKIDKHEIQKKVIDNIESIEFKNVSFRYKDYLPYVLKNINIKINANEKIAIVGDNGSGKSTFTKLLAGFYDNYEGKILVNGIPLDQINRESLLRKMGIVFQDFVKYEFTLEENLRLSIINDSKLEIENILECLEYYDIVSFPKKYNSGIKMQLGNKFDRGTELSGGEWQQISLARAIIKNADLYIMDEPSASLDIGLENNMIGAINHLLSNKICLLITHRLYNINKFAERIIVFKNGTIIEDDKVERLLKNDSYYKSLYNNFENKNKFKVG